MIDSGATPLSLSVSAYPGAPPFLPQAYRLEAANGKATLTDRNGEKASDDTVRCLFARYRTA